MADLTKMSPRSGRIIAEDGTVTNLVDLLGGGTPVGDEVYPLEKMSPSSGRVIGEDGKIYNVVDLIAGLAAASAAFGETGLTVVNGQLCQTYTNEEG